MFSLEPKHGFPSAGLGSFVTQKSISDEFRNHERFAVHPFEEGIGCAGGLADKLFLLGIKREQRAQADRRSGCPQSCLQGQARGSSAPRSKIRTYTFRFTGGSLSAIGMSGDGEERTACPRIDDAFGNTSELSETVPFTWQVVSDPNIQ